MRKWIVTILILFAPIMSDARNENRQRFFLALSMLQFDSAKAIASIESDERLKFEMLLLADILFWEGQQDRAHFRQSETPEADSNDIELNILRSLNKGYISLFYDRTKGNAYRHFYRAYQLSKQLNESRHLKASLLAFFRYYNLEVVQVSESFKIHLDHFEKLKEQYIDDVWHTVYTMIYYSKPTGTLDDRYFQLAKRLDEYEIRLDSKSPVLAAVFYEKAVKCEIAKDTANMEKYNKKVIAQANGLPFLKDETFFALIKLLNLETARKKFVAAKSYLKLARSNTNLADTLRSNYYVNLYSSLFYHAQNKNDSAFALFKRAYIQEFELDFRRNTLEVNRLNVELETQEKENSVLRLRENRTWLISALVGVALLFLASYFAYTNQRSKNRIQLQEKEVQAMKFEKALKEQEVYGIDAMVEGQEKERQRIANDLHDNLGSVLTALRFNFQNITTWASVNVPEQELVLKRTEGLLDEAYQKVRSIAHAGNVGVNAQEGLLPAVKTFVSKVSIINRLLIDVDDHGMTKRLENSLEITIFRIIQELVTNIIKHAQATEVVIHLTQHEDLINLMVEDNGLGFDMLQLKPTSGMGLHSIARKIENVGGRFTIESIPQKGTTVIIDVPFT